MEIKIGKKFIYKGKVAVKVSGYITMDSGHGIRVTDIKGNKYEILNSDIERDLMTLDQFKRSVYMLIASILIATLISFIYNGSLWNLISAVFVIFIVSEFLKIIGDHIKL